MEVLQYKEKRVSPQQAARLAVRSGDWVDYGFGPASRN